MGITYCLTFITVALRFKIISQLSIGFVAAIFRLRKITT